MIEINNLNKEYQRDGKIALKNIKIKIEKGEFTALLGQNGAGKTTLINIIGGNVKKTSGDIIINGINMEKHELETKKIIGIVPQEIGHDVFTVDEALKKQMGYFGMKYDKKYIDWLLKSLSLTEKRKSNIRELSGGMKKRFFIAKALVHKPEILFLDEPTAGVDIEMRKAMYEFLYTLHENGMTIILTTHYIEEAERLCERIIVIDQGEIIADKPKEVLMKEFSRKVRISIFLEDIPKEDELIFLSEYSPILEGNKLIIQVSRNQLSQVLQKIAIQKLNFIDMDIEKDKLEDVYLRLIKK